MTLLTMAQHEDELEAMTRRLSGIAAKTFGVNFRKYSPTEGWAPAINLYEDVNSYYVIADLAGVTGSKIDIRIDAKGLMVISGSRDMPAAHCPTGNIKLHLMEIDYGPFCRAIDLPDDADIAEESIEATYRSGFLCVQVPKRL